MARNGKIPTSQLAKIPTAWSSADRDEYLVRSTYESASRMLPRAVAETGVNFQINDAYRPFSEQVYWLKEYYEPARPGKRYNSIRTLHGQRWGQLPGKPKAASPGHSNHGLGISLDLAPVAIQQWMHENAARHGWENDVPSEPWHWSYKHPSRDRYRSEGLLDHAAVQKVVGAEVDGKIGTGTVAKIKEWQAEHGLEVDGKVGPNTKAAMGLSGGSVPSIPSGGTSVPAPSPAREPDEILTPSTSGGFVYTYTREQWDTRGIAEKVHPYDADVEGIYLHYPGTGTSLKGKSQEEIAAILRGYRRDHVQNNGWFDFGYGVAVDSEGRTYQGRGLDMEVSSNGGSDSNSGAGSILLMVSTREKPTAAMIEATNGLLAQYGQQYGHGFIRGHLESPEADTACPGKYVMGMIDDGTFTWSGEPGAVVPGETIEDAGLGKVVVDNRFGHDTVEALQRFLNSPEDNPRGGEIIDVDGKAGHDTWKALQHYLGTPVDGEVSEQSYEAEELGNGITQGWEYTGPNSDGSTMVRALQTWVGVPVDGIWYEGTTRGLQLKLNQHGDFAD